MAKESQEVVFTQVKRTDGRHRQNGSPIEMHSWRTHLKRYNPDCSNLQSYSNLFLVACYATLHPTLLVCRLVSQLVSQLVGFDWPQMLPLPTHTLMGKRSCFINYNFSWRHFLSVCRSVNCLPVHYDCPGMCECLGRGGSICPCTNVCLLHRLWNKMSQRACLMLPCINL